MRSVVVTGGAGAIGAAVLSRFRAQGDAALGIDQRADEGVVSCDVADEAAVAAAFAEVRERQGPVEVLVHSAGITGRGSRHRRGSGDVAAHPRGEPHLGLSLLSRGDPRHAVTSAAAASC